MYGHTHTCALRLAASISNQLTTTQHAPRLLSLGALTRGDRRAATVIDFSSMNLETRAGGQALRKVCEFVRAVPEPELPGLVDFAARPGMQPLDGVDVRVCVPFVLCGLVVLSVVWAV